MDKNLKRKELALRSSAAEYLTFVASTGDSDETIAGDVAVYSYGAAEDDGDLEAFLYSWKTLADK